MDLVERLVRDFRVAVIPGTTFGLSGGCYLRVSYGALDGGDGGRGDPAAGERAAAPHMREKTGSSSSPWKQVTEPS